MKNNTLVWFCICMLGLFVASCGSSGSSSDDSGSTAPTVTVTTYNGGANTALSADTRVSGAVNDAFFTATFSTAMDEATVIASNIALTCNGSAITLGTPESSDNTVWTIPVAPDLTGYVACTLTFGTGIKGSGGTAIAETSFTFNTQCANDDFFAVDTLGFATDNTSTEGNCWYYRPATLGLGTINRSSYFTVTGGAMKYDTDGEAIQLFDNQGQMIYKTFTADTFAATLGFESAPDTANDYCGLAVESESGSIALAGYIPGLGNTPQCTAKYGPALSSAAGFTCTEAPSSDNPLFIRFAYAGGVVTITHRYDSADGDYTFGTTVDIDLGSSYKVGIWCSSQDANFTQNMGPFLMDVAASGPGTQY